MATSEPASARAPWSPQREWRNPGRNGPGDGMLTKALIVLAVIALALLAWQWRHVLLLAFASVLVAAGLRGVAKPIRRVGAPEPAAIAAAFLVILSALAAIIGLFGAQIAGEFDTLGDRLPKAWDALRGELSQSEPGRFVLGQLDALSGPGGALEGLLRRAGTLSVALANGALETLLVVIAGIFFALSPAGYRDGLLLLAPRRLRPRLRESMDLSGVALRRWLGGTLLSMTAIALMVGVGLWLLGVPAPLGLALVAGIAQFVPLIGPILAAGPAVLLAFTVEPITAVWAALLYFAASTIEANVIYPLIQKHAVSQAPVLTLYAVIAFGLLFGPLGVLLAVPITVVATVFVVKFYLNGALGENIRAPGERHDG